MYVFRSFICMPCLRYVGLSLVISVCSTSARSFCVLYVCRSFYRYVHMSVFL